MVTCLCEWHHRGMKLLLLALALVACKGRTEPLPTPAEKTALANAACPWVTGAYFFEVVKDGRTSHILGTRHMGVGLAKFPETVRNSLDSASLLVEEVAPGEHDKPTFPYEPLREELGSKDWAHVEELLGEDTAKRMETKQSILVALLLIVMFEDLTAMLDKEIEARAKEQAIPGAGLETSAFQFDLLGKLMDVRLLKALLAETPDRAKLRKLTHDGLERYCTGTEKDTEVMDGVDEQQMLAHGYTKADLDNFHELLLYKRNTDWIPKLEKIFEQDNVFVAVGAGHLRGPRGVIELLKARGYAITRITK